MGRIRISGGHLVARPSRSLGTRDDEVELTVPVYADPIHGVLVNSLGLRGWTVALLLSDRFGLQLPSVRPA